MSAICQRLQRRCRGSARPGGSVQRGRTTGHGPGTGRAACRAHRALHRLRFRRGIRRRACSQTHYARALARPACAAGAGTCVACVHALAPARSALLHKRTNGAEQHGACALSTCQQGSLSFSSSSAPALSPARLQAAVGAAHTLTLRATAPPLAPLPTSSCTSATHTQGLEPESRPYIPEAAIGGQK